MHDFIRGQKGQIPKPSGSGVSQTLKISESGARIKNIIDLAKQVALQSPIFFQHGAVLCRGSQIFGVGHNEFRPVRWAWLSLPPSAEIQEEDLHWRNMHAEVSCMHNVRRDRIEGSDVFVVRVTPGRNLANSKPCVYCEELLRKQGVRKVFYTQGADSLGVLRF